MQLCKKQDNNTIPCSHEVFLGSMNSSVKHFSGFWRSKLDLNFSCLVLSHNYIAVSWKCVPLFLEPSPTLWSSIIHFSECIAAGHSGLLRHFFRNTLYKISSNLSQWYLWKQNFQTVSPLFFSPNLKLRKKENTNYVSILKIMLIEHHVYYITYPNTDICKADRWATFYPCKRC